MVAPVAGVLAAPVAVAVAVWVAVRVGAQVVVRVAMRVVVRVKMRVEMRVTEVRVEVGTVTMEQSVSLRGAWRVAATVVDAKAADAKVAAASRVAAGAMAARYPAVPTSLVGVPTGMADWGAVVSAGWVALGAEVMARGVQAWSRRVPAVGRR